MAETKENKSALTQQEQLAAWELWKEICSITGCHPESPCVKEKIARHEGDAASCQRYYDYLFVTVSSMFNDNGLKWRMPAAQKRHDGVICHQDREELCIEFDSLMLEYGKVGVPPKAYKDKIWYKAAQSPNPAVQAICGQVKYLMPALAEKYLRRHYDWQDAESYLRYYDPEFRKKSPEEQQKLLKKTKNSFSAIPMISLQTPLNNSEENYRELQDVLPYVNICNVDKAPKFSEPDSDSSLRRFYETLSGEQKIVLFAMSRGFNTTGELVQRTLGKGKTYCSDIRRGMMEFVEKKMARFHAGDLSWVSRRLEEDLAKIPAAAELLKAAEMQKDEEETR